MIPPLSVSSPVAALAPTASAAQAAAPDGNTTLVVVTVVAFFLSVLLAVYVTYQFARGYLRTRQRPLLFLTVGLVLLAPLPMFLRLAFGNADVVSGTERTVVVTASKLLGLLVILGVVYR